MAEFREFPKMARWSREIVITEKIDGTNAAVVVEDLEGREPLGALWSADGVAVYAQSRTRMITPADDNYGFAKWVQEHAEQLAAGLGLGHHFGEWWGAGIQRRYGLTAKRFSLFNVGRWYDPRDCAGEETEGRAAAPDCCHVVPVLLRGPNDSRAIDECLRLLAERGSAAAPGFMNPEGIVVFHTAAGIGFKKTIERDEVPKTVAAADRGAAKCRALGIKPIPFDAPQADARVVLTAEQVAAMDETAGLHRAATVPDLCSAQQPQGVGGSAGTSDAGAREVQP